MSFEETPLGQQDALTKTAMAALLAAGDLVYEWALPSNELHWLKASRHSQPLGLTAHKHGNEFQRLIHPEDLNYRVDCLNRHLTRQRDFYACEYRLCLPDGQVLWVEDRGAAEFDEYGKAKRLLATLRFITERKEQEERLVKLAHYDELTGHFNIGHIRESLDHALAYARRYEHKGMYLVVGIDNLSLINNALGNHAADAVIVEVGRRLEKLLHFTDVMGRVGGDHFGIIVNHMNERDKEAFLENILACINAAAIDTNEGKVGVTVSVGVAEYITDGITAHDVMSRAEVALQAAKRSGRNCIVHYQPNLQPLLSNSFNLNISEEIRAALKYGRFCLAFQPIVSAKSHDVYFYECLARIRREDDSLLAAGSFIPTAEQMGLMREIDDHIARLAIYELRKDPSLRLAVNLSGFNVGGGSWLTQLRKLLSETPNVAKRLIVEITETAALSDIHEAAQFVKELRAMGCVVALDDFGAGYTSYRQLRMLPVNMVKIDGSFANGVSTNVGNQLFVRTLIELANGFDLDTIAECVETQEDAEMLAKFGVTFLQGLYFARPELKQNLRAIEGKNLPVKSGLISAS